jgi:hypothetical protein
LAVTGTRTLNTASTLSGLSESFHPELLNGSIINVLGNLKSFRASSTTGLVINSTATVNFVGIHTAVDTEVIGRPINHVEIPRRQNVELLSTARGPRGTGSRGGVTVQANLPTIGPLTLP